MTERVLVYTCCDESYADFIPLFIHSMLFFNKINVDVEIGVTMEHLPENTERAVEIIKEMYPDSKILIKTNFGKSVSKKAALFNGKEMMKTTIRFVSTPRIRNPYVYISDIDIITLKEDCFQQYLDDMAQNNREYSNIVRKSKPSHMSGLHFTKWDAYYPLDLSGIHMIINCEEILKRIVAKKHKLDLNTTFRPVNGIHMSPNRDPLGKPSWGLEEEGHKDVWDYYIHSEEVKKIYPFLSPRIKRNINTVNKIYNIKLNFND